MKLNIPESFYKKRQADVKIPRNQTILVLSDIHCPYHDVDALTRAMSSVEDPDSVILLGDVLDFHRISKYPNDRDTLSFTEELIIGKQLLYGIRERFPNAKIYYIEGNHEVRLDAYIQRNANELSDLPSLRMEALLGLDDIEIPYIKNGFIHCGDMTFLHGHEMRGIGGVNPSRKLFAKMHKSAMCGHLHRPDVFYTRDGAGKLIQCHVIGHLGEPNPRYHPRNDWQHGYAIVDVSKNGYIRVQNQILEP